jgi:hypothetical protein
MAESPKVHRVSREDLEIGELVEKKEHPWASTSTARKIATDHLRRDPNAYSHGGGSGRAVEANVTLNQNVRVKAAKKRKPPVPKQQAPAWQTWGQELL